MDTYAAFADVYDELMADVPYDKWCERINDDILKYGISRPSSDDDSEKDLSDEEAALASERDLVADIGCGTGIMTRKLFDLGYDVFGIDLSHEMLMHAREMDEDRQIMYLNQDMRDLDLYSTIGTAVSVCDSINYLLSEDDLDKAFTGVSKFLYPGSLFIFDCNTTHKYRDIEADSTIAENGENSSFIWENFYDEEEGINEIDLTLFIKRSDGLYEKAEESHLQRGIDKDDLIRLSEKSGLEIVRMIDSDTEKEITSDTERIYAVLKKAKN